jgi:hypothetical protein
MKRNALFYIFLMLVSLTVGCSAIQTTKSETEKVSSTSEIITQCLKNEALIQVQSGAAFATSVRSTAKEIVAVCWKKIVPETEKTNYSQSDLVQQAMKILTDLLAVN